MGFFKIYKSWKPAFFIAGLYLVIGLIWIYFSDRIQPDWLNYPNGQIRFQTIKGGLYVIVTATLLFVLILKQVHRRNQLIQLLKSNNYLLTQILDKNIGFDLVIIDNTGKIIFARGNAEFLANKKTSDLEGLNVFRNMFSAFNNDSFKRFYKHLRETRQETKQESKISGIWYEIHGSVISDKEGPDSEKDLILLVFKNVNHPKNIENLLKNEESLNKQNITEINHLKVIIQNSKEYQKVLIDNLYNGIIIFSVDPLGAPGRVISINQTAINILETDAEKLDNKRLQEIIRFEKPYEASMVFKNNYKEKKQVVVNSFVTGNNIANKPIELICRYSATQHGSFIMFIIRALNKDIEFPVNNLNLDLRSVLDGFTDGVMIIQADGKCLFTNQYMKELLKMDYTANEQPTLAELVSFGGDIDISKFFKLCLKGEIIKIPHYQSAQHEKRWFASVLYPLTNKNEKVDNVLRIVKDVSSIYEFEHTLKIQKEYVDDSTKLRNLFLSNLSHEIRTPMNGIIGFVELLENEDLDQTQKSYLQYIRQSCDAFFDILDSLIKISEIEKKGVSLKKEWLEIQYILDDLKKFAKSEIKKNSKSNLIFRLNTSEKLNLDKIYTDRDKILGIWKILISNAVKFSRQGIIETGLSITKNGDFEFWVSDTGMGIKAVNIKSIFLPFTTFNNSEYTILGGLGLGLPIARAYANLFGGDIIVETKENEGSKFIVTLPLKINSENKPEERVHNTQLKKIMVVQDGVDSSKEIREILEGFGVNVIQAQNGAMAIEMLLNHPNTDLVVCDTHLSDMNGLELLHAIRRMRIGIPIIAQTSFYFPDEQKQYLNSGFEDYVVKPINKSLLFSWITG